MSTFKFSAVSQLTIRRLPPLKSVHIGINYAQCAETYERTSFRFLFFEIWSISILSKLETLTTASLTLCDPDTETLTSDTQ